MIKLFGTKTFYTPNSYTGESSKEVDRRLIATFDNEKAAKDFIESCKLKTPIKNTWRNDEPFKRKSLLGGFGFVEFEYESVPITVPHNPK